MPPHSSASKCEKADIAEVRDRHHGSMASRTSGNILRGPVWNKSG